MQKLKDGQYYSQIMEKNIRKGRKKQQQPKNLGR